MRESSTRRGPSRTDGASRTTTPRPASAGGSVPARLVLFDLDDTVSDHHWATRAGLTAVRRVVPLLRRKPIEELHFLYQRLLEEQHPHILEGRLPSAGSRERRMAALVERCGGTATDGEARRMAELYRETYLARRRAVPGIRAVLSRLRPSAQIGIVSNNTVAEQNDKLDVLGLAPFFSFVVTSEEVGALKPDPRIFRYALDKARVRADRAVMVGDSWATDIVGARAAGIRAVWFDRWGAAPGTTGQERVPLLRSWQPTAAVVRTILLGRRSDALGPPIASRL